MPLNCCCEYDSTYPLSNASSRYMNDRSRFSSWLVAALVIVFLAGGSAVAQDGMSDWMIQDKIDDELLLDPGVTSAKVSVVVADGIATLRGQVDNILAKDRAARIAEAVKGVRAVVSQLEVRPVRNRSDEEIERDIEEALHEDTATAAYQTAVTVENGVATVTGTVDSYQERKLVATVAKGVRGVTEFHDQIVVQYETDRSDYEIEQEIQGALRWNLYIDDYLIDVKVQDGEVQLSGTVGSASEKRMAETAAWVAGVRYVDTTNLAVARWTRDDALRGDKYVAKSEEAITAALQDALIIDPRVDSYNIEIQVKAGHVTLRGETTDLKAKRAAEQDAWNTVGVSSVENRLKVSVVDDAPTDEGIAQDIRQAILRDPYVERFEISPAVIDGTAHLYGTVDSYFEKNRVDDLVSRIRGVVDIENHLHVDDEDPYVFDPYIDDGYVSRDALIDYEPRALAQTDSEIQTSIESELWWSPFVDSDSVNVTVDDGIATLTGTVGSWSERRTATDNAYEGGATLVDNDLRVDSE